MKTDDRAGVFVRQPGGYAAFIPKALPPDPQFKPDMDMMSLLSDATLSLGNLEGISRTLPNPDLFVAMYVNKESLLSSQIEGTQASFIELFEEGEGNHELLDVVNHVNAMNYGLQRLKELPLSNRLLCEIHERLVRNTRGGQKNPGEFRTTQNWIGGSMPSNAKFVPPPVHEMWDAMGALEKYLHEEDGLPPLIKIGLIHAQFESIHPFADGNGRMGRLLITFWLCEKGILSRPLLYTSVYLKRNRTEYYDRLTHIREKGDWEGWAKFFLRGVAEVSKEAIDTAQEIMRLKERHETLIRASNPLKNTHNLYQQLFIKPYLTINDAQRMLQVTHPTAKSTMEQLESLGIVKRTTHRQRGNRFKFDEYMDILARDTEM